MVGFVRHFSPACKLPILKAKKNKEVSSYLHTSSGHQDFSFRYSSSAQNERRRGRRKPLAGQAALLAPQPQSHRLSWQTWLPFQCRQVVTGVHLDPPIFL